eukprot:m.293214 g.293214  ORF g.293214 m.293214 type:complete len:65 (-) comp19446_c0_seq1:422-616(-)
MLCLATAIMPPEAPRWMGVTSSDVEILVLEEESSQAWVAKKQASLNTCGPPEWSRKGTELVFLW